jgi:hypothetical protein
MSAQNIIALGTTWAIVGCNHNINHMVVLEVWVREILA